MRLYVKLALMVLVACAAQVAMSSGWASDTYFAMRCLAASSTGNRVAEASLVCEFQSKLAAACEAPVTVSALNDAVASL